uniref:AAA+ ATPase domain-containing protein n=1 Tax=viral metagenome TaxID=1070528 RepID=A0A6C0CTF7_9ZZZZ
MPKRPTRESAKDRKVSADFTDDGRQKKKQDRKASEDVVWVVDTTIAPDDDDDDSTYVPGEDELPDYDEFLQEFLKSLEPKKNKARRKPRKQVVEAAIKLTSKERTYFERLPLEKQKELNEFMLQIKNFGADSDIPLKFQIIKLPVSEYIKTTVLKKLSAIEDESGESYKLKNWVDAFLRIPFGKVVPLPVKLTDGRDKCSAFMRDSKAILDKAVFGMATAKTQIMQVLAQWIASPNSIGNVIALQGPAGVGKTSIAKNGIAKALHRPFQFFSLGGASDVSTFIGHSYTYEGSMWGRIADSLMHAKCMNPIMYFDELDKISGTPHGEEIASILIHLTDRTQNSQFHDRYFSGIEFDVSQCLFVFSFNDITQVNPILRDRMQVIHCSGYTAKEKQSILEQYVWPDLLQRLNFTKEDILLTDEASKFIISEYSAKEEGVRTLIRTAEAIITRLNMLRIADEETMKDYKFYTKVEFPLCLKEPIIKTLLTDTNTKEPETWRSMYT